mgnify:CR=1 FL=1|jgi:hypothetical protein
MIKEKIDIGNIPAVIWGEKSDKVYPLFMERCQAKKAPKLLQKLLPVEIIR